MTLLRKFDSAVYFMGRRRNFVSGNGGKQQLLYRFHLLRIRYGRNLFVQKNFSTVRKALSSSYILKAFKTKIPVLSISRLKIQSCANRKISFFNWDLRVNNGICVTWPLMGSIRLI